MIWHEIHHRLHRLHYRLHRLHLIFEMVMVKWVMPYLEHIAHG